jgi:hypothetical protein
MINKATITFFSLLFSLQLFAQNSFTSSNLPIVLINTNGQEIPDEPKITADMKIIFNGEGERNAIDDETYNYNGHVGIELRGNSSLSFNQKQYTFETRFPNGENNNISLLELPVENDWVLHAPYNDISLIRNVLAYHLWGEMGHWAPHTRMVETFLNGQYQGVYVLTETIKKDKNRLDIATLKPEDTSGLELTGGYIMRIDVANKEGDLTFESKVDGLGTTFSKTVTWMYQYPDPDEIQQSQMQYIRNYIDTVELVIQSVNFDDPVNGYSKYIDVESFIDYFIHTELSLNADGYKRSAYFYKEKQNADGSGGKLFAGPVWDYNLAFGICNFCNGNNINAWVFDGCETNPTPAMWKRLIQDPNFINSVKCRYLELRENILSEAYLFSFIDEYAIMLDEAQERHFEKWEELFEGESGWSWGGMWGGGDLWFNAYYVSSYAEEISILKNWLTERLQFLDENLGGTCSSGITAMNNSNSLHLFPNPFSNHVVVESTLPLKNVSIFNKQGKKIAETAIGNPGNYTITQLDGQPKGMYLLVFTKEDGTQISRKLLKYSDQ